MEQLINPAEHNRLEKAECDHCSDTKPNQNISTITLA